MFIIKKILKVCSIKNEEFYHYQYTCFSISKKSKDKNVLFSYSKHIIFSFKKYHLKYNKCLILLIRHFQHNKVDSYDIVNDTVYSVYLAKEEPASRLF